MSITRIRCERLADERARIEQNIEDMRRAAEEGGGRDLNELEAEQIDKWRSRVGDLDAELVTLTEDLERQEQARDISKLIRPDAPAEERVVETPNGGPVVYRTFSAYAMDKLIVMDERCATSAAHDRNTTPEGARQASLERLERALQNTLSSDVAGLVPPTHLAQIMDLINNRRPVV
jgi:HK97 family phage major capsid protein